MSMPIFPLLMNALLVITLGGKYVLEDFDRAVEDIEKGIPGKKLIYPNAEDMPK